MQQGDSSPETRAAFEAVCKAYWYPLYAFLRRKGHRPHEAADLTQGFFAHLAEKRTLGRADRARGRFRNFLLGSLKNFVRDCGRKGTGDMIDGEQVVSLGEVNAEGEIRYAHEPTDVQDPEKIFERRWALTILDRVHTRLAAGYAGNGKAIIFSRLQVYLVQRTTEETYDDVARDLGPGWTAGAVKTEVSRMREGWRDLFREEILRTVDTAGDIEDEIRHLFAVLQG